MGGAIAAMIGAGLVLASQRSVDDAQAILSAARKGAGDPFAAVRLLEADNNPPRADLAVALALGKMAERMPPGSRRDGLLDAALGATARIVDDRRFWGEAWACRAYLLSLRRGDADRDMHVALSRSYAETPYLRSVGPWRVRQGFAQWDALDDPSRKAVVDEAVWLARSGEVARMAVFDFARASDGYRPFMLRWIQTRQGDLGFAGLDRLPPEQAR